MKGKYIILLLLSVSTIQAGVLTNIIKKVVKPKVHTVKPKVHTVKPRTVATPTDWWEKAKGSKWAPKIQGCYNIDIVKDTHLNNEIFAKLYTLGFRYNKNTGLMCKK